MTEHPSRQGNQQPETLDERAAAVGRVLPSGVRKLCRVLAENGHGAWVVGGCVRDVLMGREASDWDIATSAQPEVVQKLFRRTIPTGLQHGTVTVILDREHFEVTTLRGEAEYSDGRRPDHVFFVTRIEDDLGRRDFTVNAIAFDPVSESLVDPWRGLDDLSAKVIRAVRDPMERFHEDGLRVLRAARFVSSLEFTLDPATEAAIAPNLPTFAKVSSERIRDEWVKAFKARSPSRAFEIMRRTGMLQTCCAPLHNLDEAAFQRTMQRLDQSPRDVSSELIRDPFLARLAALLWDVDAKAAGAWLEAMRFANREREVVQASHLIRTLEGTPSDALLRKQAASLKQDVHWLADLFLLDATLRSDASVAPTHARLVQVVERGEAFTMKSLKLTGADVMAMSGKGPGRYVGVVLEKLLAIILMDPTQNERETLSAHAQRLLQEIS